MYVLVVVIMVISVPSMIFLPADESSTVGDEASAGIMFIMMFILGITYFVLWIWQIFNARKLAKKFNELVRTNGGKEPW